MAIYLTLPKQEIRSTRLGKPPLKFWFISAFILCAITFKAVIVFLPSVGPISTPVAANQKYGFLGNLSLKPDALTYGDLVRNPSLTGLEKTQIDSYLSANLNRLFETRDKDNRNFINNFKVRTFYWWPVYSHTTIPPDRKDLQALILRVTYEFQFDWFKTTHYKLPNGTGPIGLSFVLFDYQSGKFVPKNIISPDEISDYLAFKKGISKIISYDDAKNRIRMETLKTAPGSVFDSFTYDPSITVSESRLIILLEATNFTKACAAQSSASEIIKGNVTNCKIDLVTAQVSCQTKQMFCSGYW